jgi:sugar lactone lactonase YvrE
MLWVALWGGSAVARFDPKNGKLLDKIGLPALNVSCCTFGGERMDELYITTASIGTNLNKYPDAGGIFKVKPGITGPVSNKFKG